MLQLTYIVQYVFGCLEPTTLPDVEGDEGRMITISTKVVDTLIVSVHVQVTLARRLVGQCHGAS